MYSVGYQEHRTMHDLLREIFEEPGSKIHPCIPSEYPKRYLNQAIAPTCDTYPMHSGPTVFDYPQLQFYKQTPLGPVITIPLGAIYFIPMSADNSKVRDWKYIPEETFRYFPKGNQIKEGTGTNYIRRIFQSGEKYDTSETQKLNELNDALRKAGFKESEWYNDANKLRFLQANKFSISKTVKSLIENSEWRSTTFPIPKNKFLDSFLTSGAVYICGRDAAYRPILVIDLGRFNLDNAEIQKTEFLAQVLGTTFEFMIGEMLIQGQVENYVLLIDLNSISLMSVGGLMKKLLQFTNNAYRSRLFVSYILNTTTSISFFWSTFKGFLSENTVKKINFCDGNVPEQLFNHCHPSQIQKRFGGKMPNITNDFFPFKQRSNQYLLIDEAKVLVSPQEYKQYYKSGILNKRKVCKALVQQKVVEVAPPQQTFQKLNDSTKILNAQPTKLKSDAILEDMDHFSSMVGFTRSSHKVTGSLIDQLSIKNMSSIRTFFQQPKYIAMKKKYYESL